MSPQDELQPTWARSDRPVVRRFVRPLLQFTEIEASSGLILLAMAAAALVWANVGGDSYETVFATPFVLAFGPLQIEETFRGLINDGLMAVFFFVVGLEIKREVAIGELRDPKTAALPVLAALGGMLFPALIYLAVVSGTGEEAARGWGIPMATDIAFALGVMSLLGRRMPYSAKLFLLALAIVDDIGAIVVIAVFYTAELHPGFLLAAVIGLGLVAIAIRVDVRSLTFYVALAVLIWFFTLESGVHATLAGVALGLMTPATAYYKMGAFKRRASQLLESTPNTEGTEQRELADHEVLVLSEIARETVAPLVRVEQQLHLFSSFVVIPIFALANAGVRLGAAPLGEILAAPVAIGVAAGLVLGKPLGIAIFSWIGVRFGWGRLPASTGWRHIIGLGLLGGIGFTVALFIAGLAFTDPIVTDEAKIGIFAGSLVAGLAGFFFLRGIRPTTAKVDSEAAAPEATK